MLILKQQQIGIIIAFGANIIFLIHCSFFLFSAVVFAQEDVSKLKDDKVVVTGKSATGSIPLIDIWYGSQQNFGTLGMPQRWINILGRVSDLEGIATLTFTLNDGPEFPLSIGPDGRRLAAPGDFNIEIDIDSLRTGLNQITIRAIDNLDNQAVKAVTVSYEENRWPLPYSIDWKTITDMQYAVQIVDGRWIIDEDGIRTHPAYVGYDRVIAIGDMSWKDYEVTVPITVHKIDTTAYDSQISIGPGFGVNMRWMGHTNSPVVCSQPHCGWEPKGGSNWYEFRKDSADRFRIVAGPPAKYPESSLLQLEMDKTYFLKARIETIPDGNILRLKMWEGEVSEPPTWSLQKLTGNRSVAQGSFLLVAHHVDATFGNIVVTSREKSSQLFRKLKNYLVQIPFLIVWVIGIILSLKYWNRYPIVSRLILIAMLIHFGEAIVATYLDQILLFRLHQDGIGTKKVTHIFFIKDIIQSLVKASAWVILVVAMFRWRREQVEKP